MLEGRLITGDQREFVVAAWNGKNESGYQPLDDKVLVLMDAHSDTYGAVMIPDVAVERQTMASETGVIVAMGAAAFVYDDDVRRKWVGHKPEPGDRVYVTRYAGQVIQGVDGKTYRLMSQACIGAVALPAAVQEMVEAKSLNPERKRRRRVAEAA